jgi:hypothetical protein
MELDDGKRGKAAVGVSIREVDAGNLRISFDDLLRTDDTKLPEWKMYSFYTHFDLSKAAVFDHALTDEEYARIGQTLMARLAALWRE